MEKTETIRAVKERLHVLLSPSGLPEAIENSPYNRALYDRCIERFHQKYDVGADPNDLRFVHDIDLLCRAIFTSSSRSFFQGDTNGHFIRDDLPVIISMVHRRFQQAFCEMLGPLPSVIVLADKIERHRIEKADYARRR